VDVKQGRIAVIAVTEAGAATARKVAAALPGAELHGRVGRVEGNDHVPFEETTAHIRSLFSQGVGVVGVCAAGILIRSVASILKDKMAEPPLLAVSPDGASVVPLLGGHHGANRIARHLAAALLGHAAVTTAGDVSLGIALDEPPEGWRVANPEAAKPVAAALLAGERVRLEVEAGEAGWLSAAPGLGDEGDLGVRVTDHDVMGDGELILHPPVLTLGVGCERGCDAAELSALAHQTLDEAGLSARSVALVASLDLKADEAAVHALAAELGVPARFFTAAELEAEAPRLVTPSEVVFRETGCHGVSEGAALAAAGAAGELLVPKIKSARATCAVAKATAIDPAKVGRPRGRLFVMGIGPGEACWRTPEVSRAIAECSDLVGYGLYLDLLGDACAGKVRHDGAMGAEEARARQAIELAAEGRTVALVCSGDAGIYALATLVFELLDKEDRPAWNRVEISVLPGISALQAAAARAGAPINHDFCTISLSDLLTPWDIIERRVQAAAEGDFVIAFYNPVSMRRRDQLPAARAALLKHRPATTPVVLARNLGRGGETVRLTTLEALNVDDVDMLTLVLVGNSESRVTKRGAAEWLYTPRGYAKKWEA
jgi:cobalt-precorrin 5A hydrolase/precorrin-3B C17-methyltransferase